MGFRLPNSRLQRAKESLIYKVQSSLLISLIGILTACGKGPSGESLLLIADLAQGQRGDPLQVSLSGKLHSTDIRELKAGRHGEDQVRETERGRLRRLQTLGGVWGVSEKRNNHPAGRRGERHTLPGPEGKHQECL